MISPAEFLRAILPTTGRYCAAVFRTGSDHPSHRFFATVDELAEFALKQDRAGNTVYHACASFSAESRKREHVHAIRSLYLDLDAGPGKPYSDPVVAAKAVESFCRTLALPTPVPVGSGRGLHVYWPLTHDLTLSQWAPYAEGLKQLCAMHGLHADAVVTTDAARILRPVGTHNRKDPAHPLPVVCPGLPGPYPLERFAILLARPTAPPRAAPVSGLNAAIANVYQNEPAKAEQVAASCAQLAAMRDTGGQIPEPEWKACLGVLAFCTDGEFYAHEWSQGDPRYNEAQTQEKFEARRQQTGPTTCAHFWGLNGKCNGCPHREQVASPTQLGRANPLSRIAVTEDASLPIPPIASTDFSSRARTDAGAALIFLDLFGPDVRYVEHLDRWLTWNGMWWETRSRMEMLPRARVATEQILHWAVNLPSGAQDREKWMKFPFRQQTERGLRSIITLAGAERTARIELSQLDADPGLLGCPNGTLDLRTGNLRPARREDFITKLTAVPFEPSAACPKFLQFLKWAMRGDEETIAYLQKFIGYALTGDVSEELLAVFVGDGANGKSTLLMTLLDLMGDYGGKARSELLVSMQGRDGAASPDVAALVGKRFVAVSETDDGCLLSEAVIKTVVSNELIAARRLQHAPFYFHPSHKIVLATNHRPRVRGTDNGIWRRLALVPFDATMDDENKVANFREKVLRPELQGIFAWAVQGCLRWQREGLKTSERIREAVSTYRTDMDTVGQWLDERTTPDAAAVVPLAHLYGDYETWARLERLPALGTRRFGLELERHGFPASRGQKGTRVRRGLRLPPPTLAAVIAAPPLRRA